MFCVTLLLAAAVTASPINVDEAEVEINEIDVEAQVNLLPEVEPLSEEENLAENLEPEAPVEEAQVDPLPQEENLVEHLEPETFNVAEEVDEKEEESLIEEIIQENSLENEVESEKSEINEDSEPEAVPYGEDEVKALEIEVEPELTQEEKEKMYGIPIDLCNLYNHPRFPLHLR